MRRRLFEDLVVSRGDGRRGPKGYALPASVAIHVAILGAVVIVPVLLSSEAPVAANPQAEILVMPELRSPAPPSGGDPVRPRPVPNLSHKPASGFHAPAPPVEPTSLPQPEELGQEVGLCLNDCGQTPGAGDPGAEGPGSGEPGPGSGPGSAGPMRVDGYKVKPPTKIKDVAPVYPELARRVGVEGIVIIECTIDQTGRVVNSQVLRGHPLLDMAALEAVQKWVYTPTLLNGVPVSVVMTVTVKFTLHPR